MRTVLSVSVVIGLSLFLTLSLAGGSSSTSITAPTEWQVTYSPMTHLLDNNDNYSKDNQFLCYDTRETLGGGIGNGTTIYKVEIATGKETLLYAPEYTLSSSTTVSAPGLGAASFSPVTDEVIFIHGPFVSEVATLGGYGTTNRRGGIVPGDGSGTISFLDLRDVTNNPTTAGALRGGTHRHEYTYDGTRVGFTYDDALLTPSGYGRTCGFMMRNSKKPTGATHYAALLIPIVPSGTATVGQLEKADGDSWVGSHGYMRGFIGKIKESDGTYKSSLHVVDIPSTVDITTASSGTSTTFPTPPTGTTIRRLTHTADGGTIRGSLDGTRIAYYSPDSSGTQQIFIIPSDGSDTSTDTSKKPVQATYAPKGVSGGVRWHPTGNSIAYLTEYGVAVTCVKPGSSLYGVTMFLTSHGSSLSATSPEALVWSRDGKTLAYNRRVATYNSAGTLVTDYNSKNFRQIFMVNFPDADGNGILDAIENGVVVSAASYVAGRVAPSSWATFYGSNIAASTVSATSTTLPTTLGGVTVNVTDSAGVTRAASLAMVSASQINFVVPAGTASGYASLAVTTSSSATLAAGVYIDPVVPTLFTANASGSGVAAAIAMKYDASLNATQLPVYSCTGGTCTSTAIDLGSSTDQVILLLFGTGLRGASTITATIGGVTATVLGFAAQSQFAGLDQVNVRIPSSLAGKGEVNVVLTTDSYYPTNTVTVNIK